MTFAAHSSPNASRFRHRSLKHFKDANANLPAILELRKFANWVSWRFKRVDLPSGGFKLTKPPVNALKGGGASHSKPETWTSFNRAYAHSNRERLPGVGFVLSEEAGYVGIDLDHCFTVETGELKPWAQSIIDLGETYAEISPSGEGLRLIAHGTIDNAHKCDPAGVEIYFKQRYLTITANHIPGSPAHIGEAPATIAACLARIEEVMPRPAPGEGPQHVPLAEARNEPREVDAPQMYFTRRQRLEEEQARARGETVKGYGPQTREKYFRNVNDLAMANLGRWFPVMFPQARLQQSGGYRVSSKALGRDLQEDISADPSGITDFGVADMGDANQGRRTPISLTMEWGGAEDAPAAGRWLCSQLGVAPEQLGWREKGPAPHVRDVLEQDDGTIIDAETGEVIAEPTEDKHEHATAGQHPKAPANNDELPDYLTRPAGVLGMIVDWITDSAQRPSRTLALGAAIAAFGTIIGRRVSGPTRSGTHQFITMLAPSAAGKDHPIKRANDIARLVNKSLVGPGEFASQQGILQWMIRSPLSLCVFDEIGAFIHRICNPRGGSWEKAMTKTFREMWGSSFETIQGIQNAAGCSEPIKWPALSLLGVSTPDEFFAGLTSREAANGFLNRFLLLVTRRKAEYIDEPAANKSEIPPLIKETLTNLYRHCVGEMSLPFETKDGGAINDREPPADMSLLNDRYEIPIGWESDSIKDEYLQVMRQVDRKIDDAAIGELYGRTAEMAVRLATIHAVSRAGLTAKVTREDFAWGRELAMWSADTMAREAMLRLADNENQANAKLIVRSIHEAGGTMKHRDLNRKLGHRIKYRDLRDLMASLTESGEIVAHRVQNPKGGPAAFIYVVPKK
jgi:hypothetical protein